MPRYKFSRFARLEAREHKVEYKKIDGDELRAALREKMREEGAEVAEAQSREEVIEELADIHDVVAALCQAYNISQNEMLARHEAKCAERGSFTKGVLLTGTWVPKGSKEHQYFLDRPEIECVDEE